MSPDKVHTVTMAAAILVTTGLGPCSAIEEAATLYDLAVERVRASGPTSKECTCGPARNWAQDGTPCHLSQCPLNG